MKKAQKVQVLENLTHELSEAKSVTVVNYQGLNTKDLEKLRQELSRVGGKFSVVKNTILKLALGSQVGIEGPAAVIIASDDEIAPLQVVAKMIKERGLPKLKFGVFDSLLTDEAKLTQLSKLPGKNTLYGQLLSYLSGPAYGLVNTLNASLQQLVYVLNQRSKQMEVN